MIFTDYFKELYAVAKQGDAREESFYPALAAMLKAIADTTGRNHVRATTLPKPTDAGNPDFRLWNGTDRIVGYVEAKKPTEERLDFIEESEQLTRYRTTFPNLILTNFFEFRLYRNGERVQTVLAARPFVLSKLHTVPVVEKPDNLQTLLDHFLDFALPKTFTAESLAVELAKRTRFLRDVINQQLAQEKELPTVLSGFYEAFKTYLIGTLTEEDFADLFAQTITYGLFASRTRAKNEFSRRAAFDNIPHTIGLLRDLFRFISLGDLPEQLEWCVDDIAEVLAVADAPSILDRYYHEGKGSDPIVHFYETFLAQYDPAEREHRGVYYTPLPVVNYIVRSLHGILKKDFGKTDGLASEGVTLLDPAAGTMTFIAYAAQQAVAEFETKYGKGGRVDFIRRHILKNFYAFELMMAPYAMGHLKMSFFLEELGHRLDDNERVPFYLTNTLDNEELQQSPLPGFSTLAEESRLAGSVKMQTPILVILGNPPYSGHSTNINDWIRGLIDSYKQVDGKPLGERNPKMLQDDYVKFLRFAQWKIEQAGCGVVGMITNHGYLDNPTFRGMRQSLMQIFDDIYILDLHGNSLKKETCPDGSPDKNVFDIRQGVAIAFFMKYGGKSKKNAIVHHAELYGLRVTKYDWLNAHDREKTKWRVLKPTSPFYLFVPRDETGIRSFSSFQSLIEIFPINSTGIKTHRDHFVLDFDRSTLLRRIHQFRDQTLSDTFVGQTYNLKSNRDWNLSQRRKDMAALQNWKEYVVSYLYRPFDNRQLYYHPFLIDWPRAEVMRHILAGHNFALCVGRQGHVVGSGEWNLVFCANVLEDVNLFYRGGIVTMPLYIYSTDDEQDLFSHHNSLESKPNLNPEVVAALTVVYRKPIVPEDVFNYIYAVLHAPVYRTKYSEFLRMDFPRIPFTVNLNLFGKMAALGGKLVALHLLKSSDLDPPTCHFEGEGDGFIGKDLKNGLRYDAAAQRVYINTVQYFEPVPEAVWLYKIGGYQVCEKWLKDRKGHHLELCDIRIYCRIVTALSHTIVLQQQIDTLYPKVEINTISMPSNSETKIENPIIKFKRQRTHRA